MATKPNNTKNAPKTAPKVPTTGSVKPPVAAKPAPKQQEEEVEVKKTDVAKLPATTKPAPAVNYDADMLAEMGGDAGLGVSTKSEDNIVPLIYVLQAQSPQALRQRPEFIPGAKAGDYWFRGTKDVVDGDEGMDAILCHMSKSWIEWKPDRGGFVMRHAEKPDAAEWVTDPRDPKKGAWEMPNGNIVNEVREHVVKIVETGEAYVLPMSGSNHGVARDWMSKCGRKKIPNSQTRAPLFAYVWRLKTVAKSNDSGDWFGVLVEEAVNDDGTQKLTWVLDGGASYKDARQLHDDFEAGVKKSDQDEMLGEPDVPADHDDGAGESVDSDVM